MREYEAMVQQGSPQLITSLVSQCYGTNPRGLLPLQEWQTDVTNVPEFGRLKRVHVTTDTFPHATAASALAGETARGVICHFCHAFSVLGIPPHVKTDNGPAYVSKKSQVCFFVPGVLVIPLVFLMLREAKQLLNVLMVC